MPARPIQCDVLVIGGGTAALCAAIAARQAGACVVLAEEADPAWRGGNTRHSRNFRIAHDGPTNLFPGRYGEEEFLDQIRQVSEGQSDEALARILVHHSRDLPDWLQGQGVVFQTTESPTLPWSKRTAFFLGGGMAMLNSLYRQAQRLGIKILYQTRVEHIELSEESVKDPVQTSAGPIQAKAVIACCGGYQANQDWLRQEWGDIAKGFINRGTAHASGNILKCLFEQGVASIGSPASCHLVAVDERSPDHDGGIITRADSISWGIVVDGSGRRFHDEAGDTGPTRYAVWGKKVLQCPDQKAFSILDAAAVRRAPPSIFPAIKADDVAALARRLDLPAPALAETIASFNQAVIADQQTTQALSPPKTQRAFPLTEPPFSAYPIRPGVTFTCRGVKVNEQAQVLLANDQIVRNLFAAGMIMSSNVLGSGYLAGAAMTIGAVFGRIAGREAARHALG